MIIVREDIKTFCMKNAAITAPTKNQLVYLYVIIYCRVGNLGGVKLFSSTNMSFAANLPTAKVSFHTVAKILLRVMFGKVVKNVLIKKIDLVNKSQISFIYHC